MNNLGRIDNKKILSTCGILTMTQDGQIYNTLFNRVSYNKQPKNFLNKNIETNITKLNTTVKKNKVFNSNTNVSKENKNDFQKNKENKITDDSELFKQNMRFSGIKKI